MYSTGRIRFDIIIMGWFFSQKRRHWGQLFLCVEWLSDYLYFIVRKEKPADHFIQKIFYPPYIAHLAFVLSHDSIRLSVTIFASTLWYSFCQQWIQAESLNIDAVCRKLQNDANRHISWRSTIKDHVDTLYRRTFLFALGNIALFHFSKKCSPTHFRSNCHCQHRKTYIQHSWYKTSRCVFKFRLFCIRSVTGIYTFI